MSELAITAEIHGREIMLTVEHGNGERVQMIRLTRAEMLAAMAAVGNAMATGGPAYSRYSKGLPRGLV